MRCRRNVPQAAVPLNMLVLGGSLASLPSLAAVHWPSTLAVVFVRLVAVPACVFLFMWSLNSSGATHAMVPASRTFPSIRSQRREAVRSQSF